MTIVEVLKLSANHLQKHGSDSPRLDAELLLAHSLGLRRLDLYLNFDRSLTAAELDSYRSLVARRANREPVAYLVGRKEFMGLEFEVSPSVLVPNPDTEALVQRAVAIAREAAHPLRVADVGTGTGCIAIAIAHYVAHTEVWASDISEEALGVAARNVTGLNVQARVHLAYGDLMDALQGSFDLVCANLPYLARSVDLPPEVTAQPATALYAAEGGTALINRLLDQAPARLEPGGRVLAEVDSSILPAVMKRAQSNFTQCRVHRDLGGHERLVEAWS